MEFELACSQIKEYIQRSNGQPIVLPSGRDFAFAMLGHYTEAALAEFERRWHLVLPAEYRYFLLHVGACKIYSGEDKLVWGIEFHRLEDVADRYVDFFEQSGEDLFSVYLPVGVDYWRQEIAAFVWERESLCNFALFAHDEHPDGWIEAADWQCFSDWIVRLVETEGDSASIVSNITDADAP